MSNATKEKKVKNSRMILSRLNSTAANDAYDRIAAHIILCNREKGLSTYAVSGCEPESGATTIACNLALAIAITNCKTVFINTDMKKGPSSNELKAKVETGLTHYLSGKAALDEVICDTNNDNLKYIPCGEKVKNSIELLHSHNFELLIDGLKKAFDYIILDTPSISESVDACFVATKADATILVVRHNKTKTLDVQNAKAELEKVGAKLMGVVLNNVNKSLYKNYHRHCRYL